MASRTKARVVDGHVGVLPHGAVGKPCGLVPPADALQRGLHQPAFVGRIQKDQPEAVLGEPPQDAQGLPLQHLRALFKAHGAQVLPDHGDGRGGLVGEDAVRGAS